MATISFNDKNKTIKIRGDIRVSELLSVVLGITSPYWEGWTLMPMSSMINEPDNAMLFHEHPEPPPHPDELSDDYPPPYEPPPHPNELPEEYPIINPQHIPDDGC